MDSELNQPTNLSDSLQLEKYHPLVHESGLKILLEKRELAKYDNYIPKIGFCVYLNTVIPVAFLFMRELEGNAVMFDSMISDPDLSSEIRDLANNMTMAACITHVKDNNISMILAFTKDDHTLTRACKHGLTLLEGFQVAAASFCPSGD